MNAVQKNELRKCLDLYLEKHNISQNEFSKKVDVNVAYISSIRKGEDKIGSSPIADKWYNIIADAIGYKLEKTYWEVKPTDQLMRILPTLEDARRFGYTNVIIGQTGSGKTYACELFRQKYIQDVFIIKLGRNDNIGDVLDKTIDELNIPVKSNEVRGSRHTRSKSLRIRKIIKHLQGLKMNGLNPTVIWDEAEFMNPATLCSVKEFYDDLVNVAALILVGTDQLLDNLENLSRNNKPGMPQFYSRIKFGIRRLKSIDRKFKLFLDNIEDKGVRDFVKENCENYREVEKVLVPAMREADRLGKPLTVDLILNILGRETC